MQQIGVTRTGVHGGGPQASGHSGMVRDRRTVQACAACFDEVLRDRVRPETCEEEHEVEVADAVEDREDAGASRLVGGVPKTQRQNPPGLRVRGRR
jgi:hypothetical protein